MSAAGNLVFDETPFKANCFGRWFIFKPQCGCGPSVPVHADDGLLLHMQPSLVHDTSGLNVRSCRWRLRAGHQAAGREVAVSQFAMEGVAGQRCQAPLLAVWVVPVAQVRVEWGVAELRLGVHWPGVQLPAD